MKEKIEKFEDLQVWKEGMKLVSGIYKNLKTCEDYSMRYQFQREAAFIPFYIAKGCERSSHREFIQFLKIASDICEKLKKHICLKIESGIIEKSNGIELTERTHKIEVMLQQMIKQEKKNSKTIRSTK